MTSMSKVSVIIPCFNDGKYIEEAIVSVRNQTYDDIEIIICDDGSTDDFTLAVLRQLESENIRVLHLQNGGPAYARNRGIEIAKGRFILPLDADDKIERTYIEKAVKIIKLDEQIGAVYCYAQLFDKQSGRWLLPDYSVEEMLVDNIVFVTALFRKDDWSKVGGFCEDFKYGIEDYDFWLSILGLDKRIVQIPEVLFFYRIKGASRTTKFNNDVNAIKETYNLIYERHKSLYQKNIDLYCKALRHALIGRIVYSRQLEEVADLKNKLNRCPALKRILKYIYKKLFKGVRK